MPPLFCFWCLPLPQWCDQASHEQLVDCYHFSYSSVETSFCRRTAWQQLLLSHCMATAVAVALCGNSVAGATTSPIQLLLMLPLSCWLVCILWCHDSAAKLLAVVYFQYFLLLPLCHHCCCYCMPSPLLCNCVPVALAILCLNVAIVIEVAVKACYLSCLWHPCCFCLQPPLVDFFHSYFICPETIAGYVATAATMLHLLCHDDSTITLLVLA